METDWPDVVEVSASKKDSIFYQGGGKGRHHRGAKTDSKKEKKNGEDKLSAGEGIGPRPGT